jgi:hypothetical protein
LIAAVYEGKLEANSSQARRLVRRAAIIAEIRRVSGVTAMASVEEEQAEPDEVAADVKEGAGPLDEEAEILELEAVV